MTKNVCYNVSCKKDVLTFKFSIRTIFREFNRFAARASEGRFLSEKFRSCRLCVWAKSERRVVLAPKYRNNFDTEYTLWQIPGKNTANVGMVAKSGSGICFVIDGGTHEDADRLENFIIENCGGKVDAWFITHTTADTAGALAKLLKSSGTRISIEKIVYSHLVPDELELHDSANAAFAEDFNLTIKSTACQKVDVRTGERIKLDRALVRVFSAADTGITEDFINNRGVVYKFNLCCTSLLYAGKLGREAGTRLLENYKNELSCDIMQIPGGGKNDVPEDIYKLASPDICIWNVDEADWKGNEAVKQTREFLEQLGACDHRISCGGNINEMKITY